MERIKKFNLVMARVEVKASEKNKIVEGIAFDTEFNNWINPELIKSFTTLEEARHEFKKYSTEISKMSGYYLVEEYAVEEVIEDEDGEFIEGGNIWCFSKMDAEID